MGFTRHRILPIIGATPVMPPMNACLLPVALCLFLAGCDIPGMGPDPRIALREADGKAIGGACRHALRGIEDCYGLNEKALKTAVFEGWKEMDQYMRENKIEGIRPQLAHAQEPDEVIIDDSKSQRVAGDAKAKPDPGLNSDKTVDQMVAKPAAR